jgi:hypothetical protein
MSILKALGGGGKKKAKAKGSGPQKPTAPPANATDSQLAKYAKDLAKYLEAKAAIKARKELRAELVNEARQLGSQPSQALVQAEKQKIAKKVNSILGVPSASGNGRRGRQNEG